MEDFRKFGALSEAANLLTMRSAIRILEVAASCRFDLSIQPKVPENLLRYVEENVCSVCIFFTVLFSPIRSRSFDMESA